MQIPLHLIDADPSQPRREFPETELKELISSIRAQGVLTPLTIEKDYATDKVGRYLLLDGERRYRSAKRLNLETVPATVIAGPLSFEERTIKRFHIQEQHQSWSTFDTARAIYDFKMQSGLSIIDISEKLGKFASHVHGFLSIADFSLDAQEQLLANKVPFNFLVLLARILKNYTVITDLPRYDIEKNLVNKLTEFTEFNKLQEFSKFMSKDDEHTAQKMKFLTTDYTLDELLNDTKITETKRLVDAYKLSVKFENALIALSADRISLSDAHKKLLSHIKTKIDDVL